MLIRRFTDLDALEVQKLYYSTVHTINIRDYTQEQVDRWAPIQGDPQKWIEKNQESVCYVAVIDDIIVGFANITREGYLDSFYVHHAYQGQGIGKRLMARIEKVVLKTAASITSDVSITAKPFFERHGFVVVREELSDYWGTKFTRYSMEKRLKDLK